jgi:hypothetical protein
MYDPLFTFVHCRPSAYVCSKEGQDASVIVWKELRDILYKLNPETASNIDSGKEN